MLADIVGFALHQYALDRFAIGFAFSFAKKAIKVAAVFQELSKEDILP